LLSYFYISILGFSFLSSLISFRLDYPFHLKLFSVLLGITFVVEFIAYFLTRQLHLQNNVLLYNFFILVEFWCYSFYYLHIIRLPVIQKIILVYLSLFPLFWGYTTFFVFAINIWNSYVIIVGSFFTIFMSVLYYYQLFTSKELVRLKNCPEFWIATALIFFYSCQLPIMGTLNFIGSNYRLLAQKFIVLQNILNILMYLMFIYSFLCKINTAK